MVGKKRYTKEELKKRLKERKKAYRMRNKDKIAAHSKIYRESNRKKLLSKKKEYREKNKKRILNIAKEYYKNNKDKVDAYKKIHHQRTKHKLRKSECIICGKPALDKYCSHKCFGIGTRGENSSNWNGGPKPYPKNWNDRFKKKIRKRDAYLCMMCDRHHAIVENCGEKKYTFWMPKFRKLLTKLYGYTYGDEL